MEANEDEDLKLFKLKRQLAAARQSCVDSVFSPRELGRIYENEILRWIYRHGFSTSQIIQLILKRTSGGYANRLVKKGLLEKTEVNGKWYYTLTNSGLIQVESKVEHLLMYPEIDAGKVSQLPIIHCLECQELTLSALKKQEILKFESERESKDKGLKKEPDIVWYTWDERIGIEVELTQKWGRARSDFIRKIWWTLENPENNDFTLDRFIIFTNSNAIRKNYGNDMKPGSKLEIQKKVNKNWVFDKYLTIPDWLHTKVSFENVREYNEVLKKKG